MKNNLRKILSILTVSVLALSMLCFSGCKTETQKNGIDFNNVEEYGIELTSNEMVTVSDETGTYLEKTLTATITAESEIADTYLDWSVYWESSSVASNVLVTDYVSIYLETLGSNVAKIRCYKNFEQYGAVVIKVSSKVNPNVYATCLATYKGEPTALNIKDSNGNIVNEPGTEIDLLNEDVTNTYTLNLQNLLGVGSEYNNFEIVVSDIVSGTVTVTCQKYGFLAGVVQDTQDITRSVSDDRTFSYNASSGTVTVCFDEFFDFDNYFTCSLSGNKLTLRGKKVIGKLFNGTNGTENYNGSTVPTNGVKAMLKSQDLFFRVHIKEIKSGVSSVFYFRLNSDSSILNVTKVTLNLSKIEF